MRVAERNKSNAFIAYGASYVGHLTSVAQTAATTATASVATNNATALATFTADIATATGEINTFYTQQITDAANPPPVDDDANDDGVPDAPTPTTTESITAQLATIRTQRTTDRTTVREAFTGQVTRQQLSETNTLPETATPPTSGGTTGGEGTAGGGTIAYGENATPPNAPVDVKLPISQSSVLRPQMPDEDGNALALGPNAALLIVAPMVMGAGQYTTNLEKTLPKELIDATKAGTWQDHHRYQKAAVNLAKLTNPKIDIDAAENIKRVPAFIHSEITKLQGDFWAKHLADLQSAGVRVDGKSIEAIIKAHPDKAKLSLAYNEFLDTIDSKYSQYWIGANSTIDDLKRVAKNLGTDVNGIFSDSVVKKFQSSRVFRMTTVKLSIARHLKKAVLAIPAVLTLSSAVATAAEHAAQGGWTPEMQRVFEETEVILDSDPTRHNLQGKLDVVDAWEKYVRSVDELKPVLVLILRLRKEVLGGDGDPTTIR